MTVADFIDDELATSLLLDSTDDFMLELFLLLEILLELDFLLDELLMLELFLLLDETLLDRLFTLELFTGRLPPR